MRDSIFVGLAIAFTVIALAPGQAAAKAERRASYPLERVFPSAVRFLRIDEGFDIREKDPEVGYVLFELKEEGRSFSGALEIVRIEDDRGRPAVRLVLRIEDRPEYMEVGILRRLLQKLRDDYGEPAPPPPESDKKAGQSEVQSRGNEHSGNRSSL